MSTLGSLLGMLGDSQIRPWDQAQRSVNEAETGLIALAENKRKQAAEAEFMRAVQNDPELQRRFFGGSVLGGLGQPPPAPGGGPMTQQTTIPGQAPGTPQVVPGGQDLSQFATQGAPQSTIASLGPQPQGPMQAPRNPVLEMAATNPQAAFMMQQQMEAREAQQFKMQEQRLKMGTAAVEHVGQLAQGVTDQASLDAMRADLVSSGLGKYAAELPQFYSKGAMEPFIAKAVAVKDSLTLQAQDLQAQAALINARKEGRSTDVDNQLRAMGVQPGQETPGQMRAALDAIQQGKVDVSAAQGRGAAEIERTEKPLEGEAAKAVSDLTALRDMTNDLARLRKDAYTGVGKDWGGNIQERLGESIPGVGKLGAEEIDFRRTVRDVQDLMARLRSGAAFPASEVQRLERLAPSISDPPEVFKAKLESFQRSLETMRDARLRTGTTGRGQLREETRAGTQGQPTNQGASGGQGGNTFTDADIAATLANPANKGKTRQQVIDAALAKGLTYKER